MHPDVVFAANNNGFVAAVGDKGKNTPVKASKIDNISVRGTYFVCFSQTCQSNIQGYPG